MNRRVFCNLALLLLVSSPLVAQLSLIREDVTLLDASESTRSEAAKAAIAVAVDQSHLPACATAGNTLCLRDGRFSIGVGWETPDGTVGVGGAAQLTSESGYFFFFSPGNVELVIKVLDACSLNNRYWVFAAGLTNVEFTIAVVDRATDVVVTYTNPQGRPAPPLQDTDAFATCP